MTIQNPTYLFYDIETTGLNKCFDQVLQFAAIRTDHAFNELSRDEITVRLNTDVIPSPGAVITHRIGVTQFSDGLTEYDAIQKIHALMNTPNTISVGYNSLGFDDEFLRFSFYKNLLPPYTHQYANQCGRMDIYPITLLYYLFKPDHLQWPTQNDSVNFKLENINAQNHLFEGQAHNAMVDVEVTLALAKKLSRDKSMWDFVTGYFHKKTDEERIANNPLGFMINGKIGSQSQFIAPVMNLGHHQHYKNQSLWLRLDNEYLTKTTKNSIKENTHIFRKRLAEPPVFLPIKERYLSLLSDTRKQLFEKNKQWVSENPALLKSIAEFYQHEKYPEVPERDMDAALYDIGFSTSVEEKLFQQFHAAKPDKKSSIATQFPNPLRQALAMRILGRHFNAHLSSQEKHTFDNYLKSIYSENAVSPVDFRGEKKLTATQALIDIGTLQKNKLLDEVQKKLLIGLKIYLEEKSHGFE